jgi:glycogen synthase
MTKWRLHIACWVPKAMNKLSEYVIRIAFALQKWSHDRASLFYLACFTFHQLSFWYSLIQTVGLLGLPNVSITLCSGPIVP